ncbi:MAG: hypothetical protein J5I62_13750 [Flavobacteriales bacterium]|nr:hypothetical protein [Flavobacteriales bacterium]MEB2341431.1 hypothetical protein [Flavobacteriia bacterium]
MNKRKLIGYAIWLVAFLFPLQYSIISTENVSNTVGLVNFVVLVVLVFLGYLVWDSGNAPGKAGAGHGH